jgi:proteasome accessory factor C
MRVGEIARYLGVSPREVTEEIRALVMMCGVPPYFPHNYVNLFIDGDRVFVRFAEHFRRPVRLTLPEALSLVLALRALEGGSAGGAAFSPALEGLRRKIGEILAPEEARSLREAETRIVAPRGPGAASAERLQALRDAMGRTRRVRIEYFSHHRGVLSERVIQPWGVVENAGDWYCVAWDSVRRDGVMFRVDRIRRVEVLDEGYEVPEAFDAARWRSREVFRPRGDEPVVRVRVGPEMARFVREESDPREIEELEDGGVVRKLRSSSIEYVVLYALRFAPHAEVLSPPEARAAVAETCAAMGGTARPAPAAAAPAPRRGRAARRGDRRRARSGARRPATRRRKGG